MPYSREFLKSILKNVVKILSVFVSVALKLAETTIAKPHSAESYHCPYWSAAVFFHRGAKPPRLNVSSNRGTHALSYTRLTLLPLTLSLSSLDCKYENICKLLWFIRVTPKSLEGSGSGNYETEKVHLMYAYSALEISKIVDRGKCG